MNVESANVSPLLPSASVAENASLPLVADGVVAEGFSEALLAQLGLLTSVSSESSVSLLAQPVTELKYIDNMMEFSNFPVSEEIGQELAVLPGKDLPPATVKINEEDNHLATLAAVTDTLRYIEAGNATKEKAAGTEQSLEDRIALTPVTEQDVTNVNTLTSETEQGVKDAVAMPVPVQMDASLVSSELDKDSKNEGHDQIASAEDSGVQEELAAAIVLAPVVLTEQEKIDNKVVQNDAIKEKVLLSFVKPLTEGAKLNLSLKDEVAGDASQQEAGSRQAVQDKQGINLKFSENAGQAEKTGQIERQSLRLEEGDKILPRVAGDMAQLNRPITDNKADVPALAKPLAHPEWNKDLGDRIVWMNNRAIPAAEIKMNPQHLGPISVRIDVNQDHQANIVFTAQHAAVREAIEASIPKLREMMSAQQLYLVDVNVSQNPTSGQGQSHSQPQSQGFAQMTDGRGKGTEDVVSDVMGEVENGQAVVSKGLLSIYA